VETSVSLLDSLRDESDGVAWQTLCDLYSPLMRNWLARNATPPADVDDLVQDVLLVVVRRIGEFQREPRRGAFRRWLKTITINCLRDHWRKKKRQAAAPGGTEFGEIIEQLADPHSGISQMWDREYDECVTRFLLEQVRGRFSEKSWKAFQRFALDGLNADEVARELEMSPNAVFIAKSRVMSKLREVGHGLID